MEEVIETFKRLDVKTQQLEETMISIAHKPKLLNNLKKLSVDSKEVKDLEVQIKDLYKVHKDYLLKDYETTKKSIYRCQMKMMYLLEHMEQKNQESRDKNYDDQGKDTLVRTLNFDKDSSLSETSIASIALKQMPTVKASKTSIFHATITNESFAKIPAYMKGRSTLLDLQMFMENTIIRTFQEKYSFLQKKRSALSTNELTRFNQLKEQERLLEKGDKFITAEDIARITGKLMDKKDDRFIQMCRHLHLIREARKSNYCCYIWLFHDV